MRQKGVLQCCVEKVVVMDEFEFKMEIAVGVFVIFCMYWFMSGLSLKEVLFPW
jgi:hypothetical protein